MDFDRIVTIYPTPSSQKAEDAVLKSRYHRPATAPRQAAKPEYRERGDRSPTLPRQQGGLFDSSPSLTFRFSRPPQSPEGYVLGTDAGCDLPLPRSEGISNHHIAFAFDRTNRLVIKDLNSTNGTAVMYGDAAPSKRDFRSGFSWIVSGDDIPRQASKITIVFSDRVQFLIVCYHQNVTDRAYVSSVARFRQQIASPDLLIRHLAMPQRTQVNSGQHTPIKGDLFIRRPVGEGTFGEVMRCWNVSTGEVFAEKRQSAHGKMMLGERAMKYWLREVAIMKEIRHPHIVKLLDYTTRPEPTLRLEFVPLGSLRGCRFNAQESVSILQQCLSAFEYLHGLSRPIVHRDLKPANILLQSRNPIAIKIADFGLAKHDDSNMETDCGTHRYKAPEVVREGRYTTAVDIWSLGVIMLEKFYRDETFAPQQPLTSAEKVGRWCQDLCRRVERMANEGGRDSVVASYLSTRMLVFDPRQRHTARQCLAAPLDLDQTPAPVMQSRQSAPAPAKRKASYPNSQQNAYQASRQPALSTPRQYYPASGPSPLPAPSTYYSQATTGPPPTLEPKPDGPLNPYQVPRHPAVLPSLLPRNMPSLPSEPSYYYGAGPPGQPPTRPNDSLLKYLRQPSGGRY